VYALKSDAAVPPGRKWVCKGYDSGEDLPQPTLCNHYSKQNKGGVAAAPVPVATAKLVPCEEGVLIVPRRASMQEPEWVPDSAKVGTKYDRATFVKTPNFGVSANTAAQPSAQQQIRTAIQTTTVETTTATNAPATPREAVPTTTMPIMVPSATDSSNKAGGRAASTLMVVNAGGRAISCNGKYECAGEHNGRPIYRHVEKGNKALIYYSNSYWRINKGGQGDIRGTSYGIPGEPDATPFLGKWKCKGGHFGEDFPQPTVKLVERSWGAKSG